VKPVIYSIAAIVAVSSSGACRTAAPSAGAGAPPPIVMPGAPGQPSQIISAAKASDLSKVQFTGDDIKFMQGMIAHHAQAIQMVELVPSRSASEDLKKLALRIDLSQQDEIKMIEAWLRGRNQQVPGPGNHRMGDSGPMPGMLTAEEMERLAAAKGAEFDRLFLEGMIKHHGGALTMVATLLSAPGAAQESEVFAFVSDVEADQRMEIDRMSAMLTSVKERQ
jgi:uncharacterized protein (DUF305 family)